MALTSIGQQKTPGRPVEVTFGADPSAPSDLQEVLLIGRAASGATGANTVIAINNVSDSELGQDEAETKFGVGSELALMVVAAIKANEAAGGSTFPPLKCGVLASTETTITAALQTAIKRVKAEFIVSPFDLHTNSTQRDVLKELAQTMSGAQRVSNNQFGSVGVGANRDQTDPALLALMDTQFLVGHWLRDTGVGANAPVYSLGEVAAAAAARMAANGVPFNPQNDVTIGALAAPLQLSDWASVGGGLESESALARGWSPLGVKPNGEVYFVRTVTSRLSPDGTGSPIITSYYDWQDFATLYYFRKTLYTRFSQPDWKRRKASTLAMQAALGEVIRMAKQFEEQGMFQAVSQLASLFQIQRNASDRHRFDILVPVNVVPGLHVIASNIQATTTFDVVSV